MAYAALVSLSQLLDQIMDPKQQFFATHHEKRKLQSLHEKIIFLTTFLDDFPREAGKLEWRITVAANEAEDIFEYHILNKNGSENQKHRSKFLNLFLSPQSPIFSGHKLKRLIKKLHKPIKEIDCILKEVTRIKSSYLSENQISSHVSTSVSSRAAPTGKDAMVGFEEDLMEIKDRLCGEPSKLQIIPITGMGGIGKTTLARYAFDDPLTLYHFDVRGWATVSQNYSIHSILLDLLISIDASKEGHDKGSDTVSLAQHVYQYLKGRRYLIVIDDVWNGNVWDDMRRVFPDDFNGSRVIITSRDLQVASYVDASVNPHEMHLMGVEESWDLLRKKVFAEEHCPPELEETGKLIAEKCRGLPLALVVVGGVLSKFNPIEDAWKSIARNVNEVINASDEPFEEMLSLSYAFLPHYLRPCFLYMGCFPEDHEIKVSKLTRLWIAEGFLKSDESKDLEQVAEDYLGDLAKRSLILINKRRYDGKIKTVKIHDMLRDLCLKKARNEKFFCIVSGSSVKFMENSRRLSILSILDGSLKMDGSCLHTIHLFCYYVFDSWKRFRLLRVVDALTVSRTSYPEEIGELLHLRYLDVRFQMDFLKHNNDVPESWSKLEYLQTLIISHSTSPSTSRVPFGMWRWPRLRHLIMSHGCLPDPCAETCDQIFALENLHTLKGLKRFTCSERMLKLIPNLKTLGIVYSFFDTFPTGWAKFSLNNLANLHKLEKLNLKVGTNYSIADNLSQNIAFPVMLKKLTLWGVGIPWKDMSLIGSLPNLQVLKLKYKACSGFKWETTEGQFSQLKVLSIGSTDPDMWITESSHFPRLERLRLFDCQNLTEIPCTIGEITTLQLIEVRFCNAFVTESAKCMEEEQHSFGNNLQVHLNDSYPDPTAASDPSSEEENFWHTSRIFGKGIHGNVIRQV